MPRVRTLSVSVAKVSAKTRWLFVQIACEDGTVGVGEPTLGGSELRVVERAAAHAPALWEVDTNVPGAFAAQATVKTLPDAAIVSAIDLALWDIHTQRAGVPLAYALRGECRSQVPIYANINRRTELRTPAAFAASARDALDSGYSALKIAPFDEVTPQVCERGEGPAAAQFGLERIAAVRALAGPACRLMVDCHWRFDEATATHMIDAAREYNVHWIECPLPETSANLLALRRLRDRANGHGMRLAGLENGIGCESFRPFCEAGAYDVMMPDVKYVGGMQEMLRCCELLSRHGVAIAPHNPSGPVSHAASLHVCAAVPDLDILEMQFDESPLFDRLVGGALPRPAGGSSALPAAAGVGVALDAGSLASHLESPDRVFVAPR